MSRWILLFLALGLVGCANTNAPQGAADAGSTTGSADAAQIDDPDSGTSSTAAADCFADAFAQPSDILIDYDQFSPEVGSHCLGTNHQSIGNIERVVFVGDSVTVGTPPTEAGDFYRSKLAKQLASKFGLDAPGAGWENLNPFSGVPLIADDGAFSTCAKWGARTDDLLAGTNLLEDCFPASERNKRTLVIMTLGGNDIASITQDGAGDSPELTVNELWMETESFVNYLDEAMVWLKDPARFPGGVDVVFANLFEFTDATGDVSACPAANAAGFEEWNDVGPLEDMVVWANEQYMRIAVDHGADMLFNLEHFCGHGYKNDDPESPCYRGPNMERWYDLSCIHPTPGGHQQLVELFMAVIDE
jgi:lysophospholipase L1-like esterase